MPEETLTQETPGEPQKVVFDDAQKARINEIVKEATARAGAEARAETARLKEAAAAAPQSTDALLKLAEAQAELTTLKSESQEAKLQSALQKAVSSTPFFDPILATSVLRSSIRLVDGQPVVIDANGAPRLGPDFNPMTLSDLAIEL